MRKRKIEKLELEVLEKLSQLDRNSEEYQNMVSKWMFLKSISEASNKKPKISWDTVITVLGSLAGILIVVFAEETRVISSKAWTNIIKGRV